MTSQDSEYFAVKQKAATALQEIGRRRQLYVARRESEVVVDAREMARRREESKSKLVSRMVACGAPRREAEKVAAGRVELARPLLPGESPSPGYADKRVTLVGLVDRFFRQNKKNVLLIATGHGGGKTCALAYGVAQALKGFGPGPLPRDAPAYWHAHDLGAKPRGYEDPFMSRLHRLRYLMLDELGSEVAGDGTSSKYIKDEYDRVIARVRRVLDRCYSDMDHAVIAGQVYVDSYKEVQELKRRAAEQNPKDPIDPQRISRSFGERYGWNMYYRIQERGALVARPEPNWRTL